MVELLAVIAILAIIALIATPLVLKVVNNSKTNASEESVKTYLSAVELSLTNDRLTNNNKKNLTGKYQIIDNGKKIKNVKNENVIAVNYNGSGLESGFIDIKNGTVEKIKEAKIGASYAAIVDGNVKLFNTLPESEMITGNTFNAVIKSLVSGETKKYGDYDNLVKSVRFLSYGKLPSEYSYDDLKKMDNIEVSQKKDNSIIAYHDGVGNVFIYSKNLIVFNSQSGGMFYRMQSVKNVTFDIIDTSNVINLATMFENCNSLESVDLTSLDTSKVTSMFWMFYNCYSLTEIDLSNFDTSNVTNMERMFVNCKKLTEIDVTNFNTSNVTTMAYMFNGCSGLTDIDLSNFDTGNVTTMWGMFHSCTNLKKIDVSNFETPKLTGVAAMFESCTNVEEIKLGDFYINDTTSLAYMFSGCSKLEKINLTTFDTSDVTSMNYMFNGCKNLTEIVVSDKWVIGDTTTTANMFRNCGTDKVTLN